MQSSRKLTLPYFLPERNLILRNPSVIKYSVSTTLSPYHVSLTAAKILFLLILISLSTVFDKSYKFISFSKTACIARVRCPLCFFFFFFHKTVPLHSLIHRLPYSANSNYFVHYFLTTNRSNHFPWLTTLATVVEELSLEMTTANHSRCHNRVSTKNGCGRFERVQSV